MKKISLILFVLASLASNLFAADPSIYTWGYGEIFYKVLQGVTIISQESYLITSAVAVGGLLLMIKNTASGGSSSDMAVAMGKYLFITTIIIGMFSTQTKRYIVEDEITGQTFIVNNVPIGIGETFSLFTNLEKNLAKAFEVAFSTPNSISYSKTGLGFTMSAPINLGKSYMVDAYAVRTFNEYMGNCVFSAIAANEMSGDVLTMSKNLKNDLEVNGYLTPYYSAANPNGVDKQCQEAWADLSIVLGSKLDSMEEKAAEKMMIDQTTFQSGMAETTRLMFGVSQNSKDYLFQQTLINMTNDGLKAVALSTGGDASALAYAKALSETNQRQTWAVTGILAQQNLPLMKAVMTVLVLGVFVLLVLLSIIYGDLGHIKMGFTLLFAMVLWTPLALLVNGMFNIAIERILPDISNGGLTMVNINDVSENLKNYLSFLGYLAASIPIFAYSIAKKSEHGFVSLFSGVGGASSSAASAATSQTSSGNINAGNSRLGSFNATDQYGTHDYAGNNSWKNSFITKDGTSRTSYSNSEGKGLTNTDSGGAADIAVNSQGEVVRVSNSTTGVSVANGISDNYNMSKQETSQLGDAFSSSFARNTAQTLSSGGQIINTGTFADNKGVTHQTGEALNSATNESIQKTLNDMKSGGKDLTFTTENGTNLSAHAGFSPTKLLEGITGFKAGVDGALTFSGKTADGESYSTKLSASEADSFMKSFSTNLSEQIQKTDGLSFALADQVQKTSGYGDSDTRTIADNYAKSYNQTEALSEQYSTAQKRDKNFTEDVLPKVFNKFIDEAVMKDGTKLSDVRKTDATRAAELAAAMMRDDLYKAEKMNAIDSALGVKLDTSKAQNAGAMVEDQKGNVEKNKIEYLAKGDDLRTDVIPAVERAKENTVAAPRSELDIDGKKQNIQNNYDAQSNSLERDSKKSMHEFKDKNMLNTEGKIDEKAYEAKDKVEKAKDTTGTITALKLNPLGKEISDATDSILVEQAIQHRENKVMQDKVQKAEKSVKTITEAVAEMKQNEQ
ncbi:MAG: conjugal transfer protein TraG N-terminal domain-containing protein [Sulfurimonas sp.]|nr:conjugal transfer protein TraG N-terminal domain-containing protein [Sulfurimonas sp.]